MKMYSQCDKFVVVSRMYDTLCSRICNKMTEKKNLICFFFIYIMWGNEYMICNDDSSWKVRLIGGDMWCVTMVFISYLFCVNIMLCVRYCNVWWNFRGGYDKYTVRGPITNTHEIISAGCESAWRRIGGFNSGRWYLRCLWRVDWWR